MSETALSKAIREALDARGVWSERVQSGSWCAIKRNGVRTYEHWIHGAQAGTPDLVLPALSAWLEIKQPGKKPNADQLRWHKAAQRAGVRVAVVDSVKLALAVVRAWEQADR
jgi:VRR-NUC domain.